MSLCLRLMLLCERSCNDVVLELEKYILVVFEIPSQTATSLMNFTSIQSTRQLQIIGKCNWQVLAN